MTYLFGDSSPSSITIDYIDFLRRVLDFTVEMLCAEERIDEASTRQRELEEAVRLELDQLEQLGGDIHCLLDRHDPLDSEKPTARCARTIGRAVAEAISAEMSDVRADLTGDIERIESEIAAEREVYVRRLDALLQLHDLPRSKNEIHLALDFGEHYTAQLRGQTPYGAATSIDLDIPGDSPFARQVRVSRFVTSLDIRAPERVGWIRKQVKSVRHNVSKHYLIELSSSPGDVSFKLRATPDPQGPGYNVIIQRESGAIEIAHRSSTDGELTPFDLAFEDVEPLLDFGEMLARDAEQLEQGRRALLEVTLDGKRLTEHECPAQLVDRMIEAMAPVVREIAEHSQSPEELVLRSPLSDNRREEIFARKSELARKLSRLPEPLHEIFASLDLGPIPAPSILPVERDDHRTARPSAVVASARFDSLDDEELDPVRDSGLIITGEINPAPSFDSLEQPVGKSRATSIARALAGGATDDERLAAEKLEAEILGDALPDDALPDDALPDDALEDALPDTDLIAARLIAQALPPNDLIDDADLEEFEELEQFDAELLEPDIHRPHPPSLPPIPSRARTEPPPAM